MRIRFSEIVLLCFILAFGNFASAAPAVNAFYECLWWSPDQMRDIDPNNPPAKSTSVRITRWEYSDPIGVPHPNIVTLVVQVPRQDAAKVEVRTQWLGKIWSQKTLRAKTPLLVTDGTQQILRYDIPVDAYINAHGPKRLRSSIYLGGMKVKDVDLPIQLGD